MTARERLVRDDAIVAARARGLTWRCISRDFDLTERQCRRIMAGYRKLNPPQWSTDPSSPVIETIELLDNLLEEAALLANETNHAGVRLGAIRARHEIACARLALLEGVAPRTLRRTVVEVEARQVAELMVDVLERHDVPERVVDEILALVEGSPEQIEGPAHDDPSASLAEQAPARSDAPDAGLPS